MTYGVRTVERVAHAVHRALNKGRAVGRGYTRPTRSARSRTARCHRTRLNSLTRTPRRTAPPARTAPHPDHHRVQHEPEDEPRPRPKHTVGTISQGRQARPAPST